MFVEIIEGGGAVLTAIEHRKSIVRVLKRISRLVLQGKWNVPVFGDGGTGKTTLGKFLSGELDLTTPVGKYESSITSVTRSLPGDIPCLFLIPPGQKRWRKTDWNDLYNLLASGKAGGIINVVSYGYHSTELEHDRHVVYRKGMSEADFLKDYLNYNRKEELAALDELLPHLEAAKSIDWMITLVAKQDLWWDKRQAVLSYYKDGEYGKRIQKLTKLRGEKHFKHLFYSGSLITQNLTAKDGSPIAYTAKGYDQPLTIANLNNFFKGLNDLLKAKRK